MQCIAQGERNNWYFGDSIGITFNTGYPVLLNNIIAKSYEASSSISTKNGAIIFYGTSYLSNTGGSITQAFNSVNSTMLNSFGINTNASITQGQIIISNPNDSNNFFLFTLDAHQGIGIIAYYSTIDITLDSGRGAIVQKNILLCDTPLCEKMTAVKHANGRDWWLLTHEFNTNNFFEYLITPAGISGPTVISAGSCIGCNSGFDYGQMIFNKDGDKLCSSSYNGILDLFDFDRCSGNITLNQSLGIPYNGIFGWTTFYGCSFSEDGQVLYASRFDTLWQYNLNASNIKSSRLMLMYVNYSEYIILQHLIGPNNKIYITTARNNGSSDSLDYKLSVINYPDSVGLACDIQPHSIWLGGHRARGGLPNLPHYELGALAGSACDTLTGIKELGTQSNTLLVYPNPASKQLAISNRQLAIGKVVTVTVYDVLGKVQLQQKITTNTIDVSTLAAGIYMLQVLQGDKVFYGRFVKE